MSSSRGVASRQRASQASSAPAASALPPAMPPAIGIALWMCRSTDGSRPERSASSTAARNARLLSSSGSTPSPSPDRVSVMPGASEGRATISSHSPTAWNTVASSWKPSGRGAPTDSWRFTLAGTRTVTEDIATCEGYADSPDEARSRSTASASAIRAKALTSSCSPLSDGSTPAATSALSAVLGEPASDASAERRVLRRWEKAASIDGERGLAPGGRHRRLAAGHPHQAGLDVRHRPEHGRPDAARGLDVAVPPRLHAGDAVDAAPGRRGEPVGDLLLHHDEHRCRWTARPAAGAAPRARRCCTAGWRRAPSAAWDSAGIRMASAVTTSSRSANCGSRSATVAGRRSARTGSISTAMTERACGSSASVRLPRPGPTSSTTSSSDSRAARTMRRTVFGSVTKFWPESLRRADAQLGGQRPDVAAAEQAVVRGVHHQVPKARCALANSRSHIAASSVPRSAAMNRTVCGMRYDAFGLPRCGTGVR